jgi:hypothetical protein
MKRQETDGPKASTTELVSGETTLYIGLLK